MNDFAQASYTVGFDWGPDGLDSLSRPEGLTIIIDVLSFTTCVSIAVDRNAVVFPYQFKDGSAALYAASVNARLAGSRHEHAELSLSPASMATLGEGDRVVLPSPNGASLSLMARSRHVVCGCLRNRTAVAAYANRLGLPVAVIAAGEKWPNGNLRPAIEDYLGAGSILASLKGKLSPEAEMVAEAFTSASGRLQESIADSVSGRELVGWGFPEDVDLACEVDASGQVPVLREGKYGRAAVEASAPPAPRAGSMPPRPPRP
jgi:2-phosphosulfolactate phosphatase